MTQVLSPDFTTSVTPPVGQATTGRRNRWALWGAAAGVFGGIATLLPTKVNVQPANAHTTAAVIDKLHRWPYQVSVIAGFAAVACLLVAAAGWRRWAEKRAPESLAASVVAKAFTASAGAMMIAYGFAGALSVYLHGGIDAKMFSSQGLFSLYMILDFGPFIAWWGVTVAAAALAYAAFREGRVPKWVGVVSVAFVLIAVLPLIATGLPGMPGVIGPLWLAAVSVGLARSRRFA
jgi:hypothetical protein